MTRFDHPLLTSISVPRPARKGWLHLMSQTLGLWEQRRKLAGLDEAALRDIGLTRDEAMTEAQKPLWDVPANWLR